MTAALRYVIFITDMGWIGILSSSQGLVRITLPQPSAREAHELLGHAVLSPWLFSDLIQRLRTYFSGHKATFPDSLDLSGATAFQRRVWEVTGLIPYGETRSYGWVARQIDKPGAARAVGQALAQNPLPIIVPCHRVVTSRGKLGGYSWGVEMKRYLLGLEASASTR
jgi:methylated-DNA-[protein]-cysteine S-methyltransferase